MTPALAPPRSVTLQTDAGSPVVVFAPPPRSAMDSALGASHVAATVQAPPAVRVTRVAMAAPASPHPAPTTARIAPDTAGVAVAVPTRPLPSPAGIAPMTLLKTTLAASTPLVTGDQAVAQPADGLWVLATASCPLPVGTDLNAWAGCTQPLGFNTGGSNGGELAVLEKPKGANKAAQTGGLFSIARTRYRLGALAQPSAQGLPGVLGAALVQVEVPGITGRSYVYIVVRPEIVDGEGRFVAARAWGVACPPPATPNVSRRGDRCFASTLAAVKDAASAQPGDGGYVLRWIDPTDAGIAGDTTGARAYAPPPSPVFQAPRKLTPLEAATPLSITDLPPDLAAQQPATPDYAPRDDGGDDGAAAKPATNKPVAKKASAKRN